MPSLSLAMAEQEPVQQPAADQPLQVRLSQAAEHLSTSPAHVVGPTKVSAALWPDWLAYTPMSEGRSPARLPMLACMLDPDTTALPHANPFNGWSHLLLHSVAQS